MRGKDKTGSEGPESRSGKHEIPPSDSRYQSLIERIPAVVYIAEFGPEERWSYVNPQIEKLLGFSAREWIAGPASWSKQLHPEDREKTTDAKRASSAARTPFMAEYRLLSRDQRVVWVRDEAVPISGERDTAAVMQGVLLDITESKPAQLALRSVEERLSTTLNHAPVILFAIDKKGVFTLSEGKALRGLGLKAGEVIGKNIFEVYAAFPLVVNNARRALAGEEFTSRAELPGLGVTYEVAWTPKKDGTGNVTGAIGVITDISDRHRAEQELLKSEQQIRAMQKMEAIGRLAGGVAHDFNNLLMVVGGQLQLLRRRVSGDNASLEAIQSAQTAADQAAALVRQLLAFGRMQTLQPEKLNLNTLLKDMRKLIPPVIGAAIEMEIKLDPGLGWVQADVSQMEQVILNLVVNARDAMPNGGRLLIATHNIELDEAFAQAHPPVAPGSHVALEVSDSGVGMDAETQARIFEPFFTTKPKTRGSGLGLASVYGVVKQSGGYIAVESAPQSGTTFRIYLPRIAKAERQDLQAPKNKVPSGSETILVADDESGVRDIAKQFLQRHGYSVLEARNAKEALEMVKTHSAPIALLLSDLQMPGTNGQELAKQVLASKPGMKVLYMSGYSDTAVSGKETLSGKVLAKPFTMESLAKLVRATLDEVAE